MSNEQKIALKLSAIKSADVKGYSIMMSEDEVFTIKALKAYRQIISALTNERQKTRRN